MNTSYFAIMIMLIFILRHKRQDQTMMTKLLMEKGKEHTEMEALARQFIEKYCIIYTFNAQIEGVLKSVENGAALVERKDHSTEVVNLSFVVRIREYPVDKNGKRKSVVID